MITNLIANGGESVSDKLKIILSAVAIITAGVFVISFILSPSDSEDFPDGGTWTKCSACQKTQVVDSEARGVFYDENPNMMGRPMVCPKCKKGSLIDGLKCPVKGCFYTQAKQKSDGSPVCPVCNSNLP